MCGHVLAVGLADRVVAVAQVDGLPPHTGLTVSGRPSLADGLPNTAMAATWSGTLGGSGLLNPTTGIGTALMTSITAAPCEYPPSTSLVLGQLSTMYWM